MRKKLTQLWLKQRRCSPECIINVSKRELTILEKEILRFGLDNHILPNKPKVDDIKCSIERTLHSLKTIEGLAVDDEIRDEIKFATKNFTNNAKILCSDRKNTALHRTQYNLSQEPDIKVCNFDKGRGVVIMDSNDYYSKLDDIVNDQSKFHELKVNSKIHPVIAKEKSISYYVRKYLQDFGPETMRRLIPSGSNPGKIYGLVKIHKRDNPLRPVVSMIGTPEYQLAKFLDSLIKPYIPQTYMLQSTNQFLDHLANFQFHPAHKLVSFDVSSLFTNIPLEETIQIITDTIYSDQSSQNQPIVNKEIFAKLLRLATKGIFMHRNKFYEQHDGVSMGSPLGPTIANFFLAHMENKLLNSNLNFQPKLYLRYVDDIFAVFNNDTSCSKFLDLLNSQHKSIKFTVEHASETIPFLDVEIKLNHSGIDTWIWKKPTHTNLLLNFNAFCPLKWKSGLILCLLNRAKRICSNNTLFQKEAENMKAMFKANGYPSKFFDKLLQQFQSQNNSNQSSVDTDQTSSSSTHEYPIVIPYFGKDSRRFVNKFSKIIRNQLNVKIIPIYKSFKVKSYFQLKSKTPVALCSNVVYHFTCSCDTNKTYIGMSSRHLSTRVQEHLNFNSNQKSSIKDHIMSCNICSNKKTGLDSFKIIRKCRSEYDTKIHEALLIKKHSPALNRQLYANGSSFLLQVF